MGGKQQCTLLLSEQFRGRTGAAASRNLRLTGWILATGLERLEPPAPLPPITESEERLMCWMAVVSDADEGFERSALAGQ